MSKKSVSDLALRYPNVHAWVLGGAWVEVGQDRRHGSFARALDEGGQVWEGERKYRSLEEALKALDRGIADWLQEHG